MVTDTFDSIKFRLTDDHRSESIGEYDRARAALVENLLFREEPLELTFPQLFDGYFATLGEDADERQNTLFNLLERGHIKITSYYFDSLPDGNPLFNYLMNFPFKNAGYIYSSMPFLTQHINETDSGVAETFENVKNYILRLFEENPISVEPIPAYDGTVFAAEMLNFTNFFRRLTSCEAVRNQSAFSYHKAVRRDFSVFLNDALSENREAAVLFSLSGKWKILEELRQCKNRSECYDVINRIPDDGLSDIRKKSLDILYNKFTFSVFPNHEINVQQLYSEGQSRLLWNILRKCDNTSSSGILRYQKNETKQMYRFDGNTSFIALDDAFRMRGEIAELKRRDKIESWYAAVRRYRDSLNLRLFGADEEGNREFCISGMTGINKFTAVEGLAAVVELTDLENAMTHYEKTFTFESGGQYD